jgi:hypothetical protein
VRLNTPENFTALGDSATLRNETTGRVAATSVQVRGGQIVAEFDAGAVDALANGSDDLDVYGRYNDSQYPPQFVYFGDAVVNAEVVGLVATGPFPAPIAAGTEGAPTDPDDDGRYEDVDGSGNVTFQDAVDLGVEVSLG